MRLTPTPALTVDLWRFEQCYQVADDDVLGEAITLYTEKALILRSLPPWATMRPFNFLRQ